MSSVFAWLLLSIILATHLLTPVSSEACKEAGWFGDSCRYQCHCEDGVLCDFSTGRCPGACHPDWFGPSCQYVSSKFSATAPDSDITWLADNDPQTCNPQKLHTLTLKLDTPQPITWVRFVVNDPEQLDYIQGTSHLFIGIRNCPHAKSALVDNVTIDVACETTDIRSHITLTGSRLENLCSFYISGGRNVALSQSAKQPSTYLDWVASKAVDGNTGADLKDSSLTCAHTDVQLKKPAWWAVEFHRPMHVTQFKVFNRPDCCMDRLVGLRLDAFREESDKRSVFSHQDSTPTPLMEYTITPRPRIAHSVERVYITKSEAFTVLTICEVMVFGDSDCGNGKFGLECEGRCNCASGKPCFVSTGGCPSGCAPGYMGEDCSTACPRGTYGPGCTKKCSANCDGNHNDCDPRQGACLTGCEPGYQLPQCDRECNMTTYGQRCDKKCSIRCLHGDCHHLTGNCKQCPTEFKGDLCDQVKSVAISGHEKGKGNGEDKTISNTAVVIIVVVFAVATAVITIIIVCIVVGRYRAKAKQIQEDQYDFAMRSINTGSRCGSVDMRQCGQNHRDANSYMVPTVMAPPPENIYETP